jgi:hypothetical protein
MSRFGFLAVVAFWVVMVLLARTGLGVFLGLVATFPISIIGGIFGRGVSAENLVFDAVFLFSAACLIVAGFGVGELRKGETDSGYRLLAVAVSLAGLPLVVYLSLDKLFAHWP